MWKNHMEEGSGALESAQYPLAEQHFFSALEYARDNFWHTDERIARTYACLGHALLMQKKVEAARPPLRQAVAMAAALRSENPEIITASYLWAYIDLAPDASARRDQCLSRLKKHLSQSKTDALVSDLAKLFTVSPEAPEPAKKAEEPKPAVPKTKVTRQEWVPEVANEQAPLEPVSEGLRVTPTEQLKAEQGPEHAKPQSTFLKSSALKPAEMEDLLRLWQQEPDPVELPQRFLAWSVKINAGMERAKSIHLSELIAAYVELLELMPETVQLYRPPHKAVGDHLSLLAEIANAIGLYERAGNLYALAARNYEFSLGANHSKTAEAKLAVAHVHRELDQYDEADCAFREAMGVLTQVPGVDLQWINGNTAAFLRMQEKAKAEKQFDKILEQMAKLTSEADYTEAEKLARTAAELLVGFFPADHYLFTLLYRRHAFLLAHCNRRVEADALNHVAQYLERKLNEKHEFNKSMDAMFPDFSLAVAAAIQMREPLNALNDKNANSNT